MFTKYTECCIILNTEAETIINSLRKVWLSKYPKPQNCITDNGRQFVSLSFKNFLKTEAINHILSAPNNPTGNSAVERVNKEIVVALRISRDLPLEKLLDNIWRRVNLNINLTTGYPPFELFHGKPIFSNAKTDLKIDLEMIRQRRKKCRKLQQKMC
ncbi:Gag-Pro-Pol polyprotein [Dictyocoela roeselum]|nr:Gag-Pro-Pol polyprotein [Dictyocoela roeselum]